MSVLKTLVDERTKNRFRAAARERGLSESELLRSVVLVVTGDDDSGDAVPVEANGEAAELERMTLRMPRFLMEAAKARASVKRMAPSRWVAALVQSHLTGTPVMTADELATLQASSRELAAIGRNINQIAHALNTAFYETERVKLEILDQLREVIIRNRADIRALVRASQNAWRADNGVD